MTGKKLTPILIPIIVVIVVIAGICIRFVRRGFSKKKWDWSIGIYSGSSPLSLSPHPDAVNPVISASDVTGVAADYVADPFLIRVDTKWYLFFEVFNAATNKGEIGLATSSDGVNFSYEQIVLDEPYHLSYPYVFEWQNQIYMIPESAHGNRVRLYGANPFPTHWGPVTDLVTGFYVDSSILNYDDTWFLFSCSEPVTHNTLELSWADELTGPWHRHPMSPIVPNDFSIARPAGRVISYDGRLIRFAQDCRSRYGRRVLAIEITTLTKTEYAERPVKENPILDAEGLFAPGPVWNRHGMHNLDAHEVSDGSWLAAVDGYRKHLVVSLEY